VDVPRKNRSSYDRVLGCGLDLFSPVMVLCERVNEVQANRL
jgi:hypothetical protein